MIQFLLSENESIISDEEYHIIPVIILLLALYGKFTNKLVACVYLIEECTEIINNGLFRRFFATAEELKTNFTISMSFAQAEQVNTLLKENPINLLTEYDLNRFSEYVIDCYIEYITNTLYTNIDATHEMMFLAVSKIVKENIQSSYKFTFEETIKAMQINNNNEINSLDEYLEIARYIINKFDNVLLTLFIKDTFIPYDFIKNTLAELTDILSRVK
jgi:hypothetical protein